jgi:hypothetical protein
MDKYILPQLEFEYAALEPQGRESTARPGPETVHPVVYSTLPDGTGADAA